VGPARLLDCSPAAAAAAVAAAGAAPALAAEVDAADAYNAKVLEVVAYGGVLAAVVGFLVQQTTPKDRPPYM
ncbi:unnamed protein product, partial [Prorocentrum cordatum]